MVIKAFHDLKRVEAKAERQDTVLSSVQETKAVWNNWTITCEPWVVGDENQDWWRPKRWSIVRALNNFKLWALGSQGNIWGMGIMWLALHYSDNLSICVSMWSIYLQETKLKKKDLLWDSCSSDEKWDGPNLGKNQGLMSLGEKRFPLLEVSMK